MDPQSRLCHKFVRQRSICRVQTASSGITKQPLKARGFENTEATQHI
jgi:hypothetical protein